VKERRVSAPLRGKAKSHVATCVAKVASPAHWRLKALTLAEKE
jgi:hypothetical protein